MTGDYAAGVRAAPFHPRLADYEDRVAAEYLSAAPRLFLCIFGDSLDLLANRDETCG
jgi:hypothetical protein